MVGMQEVEISELKLSGQSIEVEMTVIHINALVTEMVYAPPHKPVKVCIPSMPSTKSLNSPGPVISILKGPAVPSAYTSILPSQLPGEGGVTEPSVMVAKAILVLKNSTKIVHHNLRKCVKIFIRFSFYDERNLIQIDYLKPIPDFSP